MRVKTQTLTILLITVALAPLIAGCGYASQISGPSGKSADLTPLGEREGTIPASAQPPAPTHPAGTPLQAIQRFVALYANWTYRTLRSHESELATMSVGAARDTALEGAARAERDTTIRRGHLANQGAAVAISPLLAGSPSDYVVVTKEQTTGDQEYAGVAPAYHVILAAVQKVSGKWAVSLWLPKS